MIRLSFILALGFLLCAVGIHAQTTNVTVTGTIVDPNGTPYQNATVTALAPPNSLGVTATTSATGAFSMSLPVATVGGSQYIFSVATQGILPPKGTGPQSFQVTQQITGAGDISGALKAAAPSLIASYVTPSGISAPGNTLFSVKTYGAFGDSASSNNCTVLTLNVNCTDANFTAADIGKRISCSFGNFGTSVNATSTIAAFVNATNITLNVAAASNQTGICVWGHPDDTAVSAAVTAAVAAMQSLVGQSGGNPLPITADPCVYFPAGSYNLFNTAINVNPSSNKSGFCIIGDGIDQTRIYWNTGSTPAAGSAFIVTANAQNVRIENLTLDGMTGADTFSNGTAVYFLGNVTLTNVNVKRFGSRGVQSFGTMNLNNFSSFGNQSVNIDCQSCNGEWRNSAGSNSTSGANINIQNTQGSPFGNGVKMFGGLNDECGGPPCFVVQNSTDVWLTALSTFSSMSIDGTSHVHQNGGLVGAFNNDTNISGVRILSGGVYEQADVRNVSTGTGKCINNSGTYINNGNNSCESLYGAISAATESVNTVTLTVATLGANVSATCAVGDSVLVQGVIGGGVGYNGFFRYAVTAVGTNTLSYTNPTSGLTSTSGGIVYCIGMTTYAGTLPYSTLTPTPNTCYVTVAFAAVTLCNQFVDRSTNIYRIKASSSVTTACTVAPVVTISDGTNTATLTITTAKASWDSSVDASTGVGTTIFTPHGGTLTVTTTAGTCTTSPANFALTYTMQGIMDNF